MKLPRAIPKIAQKFARTADTFIQTPQPAALADLPTELRVELDVRPALRAGNEPFSIIMAAIRTVPAGGALILRATFEPVPLYLVLSKQGFAHWTELLGEEDWRVWFYPASLASGAAAATAEAPAHAAAAARNDAHGAHDAEDAGDDVIILDVRDLEPPEPMMRTLAALESLPPSKILLQINARVPMFLLPVLEERGFTYEIREQEPGLVRVFIQHRKEQQ
jgi:uncharacterized protein (DUF2249 family)